MKFRLKMDLSQFYDDERNLAYILVDPQWNDVQCLQKHVEKLFNVPDVQFLTNEGVYIPLLESIDVIKTNDILKAIVPATSRRRRKRTKSSSGTNGFAAPAELSGETFNINTEKRKCDEDVLASSTPNLQPKKKLRKSKTRHDLNETEEQNESNIQALQNSNTVTSTIDSNSFDEPQEKDQETMKTRKRKRTRKSKKSKEDEKSSRLSSVPVPISSSTLRNSKSMSTPNNSSAKHVQFTDDEPTLVSSNENPVIYRNLLSWDTEARTIQPENVPEKSHAKKPIIQIQEHIVLVPAPAQDVLNDSSVIEIDDSLVKTEKPDIDVEGILQLSEELKEMPNVGDIVLFKVYKLSETCTPEITSYICGRCEEVDVASKTVNCLVLDGVGQLDENRLRPTDKNPEQQWGRKNYLFSLDEMLERRVVRA